MRFIALNKTSHADFHPNGLIGAATMSDAYTLIQNGLIIDGTGPTPSPAMCDQRPTHRAVGADAGASAPPMRR